MTAAFVPLAHLILVPACVVGGTFYLVRGLKARAIVTAAHGACPDCGTEQPLELQGPWPHAKEVVCRRCHRPLRIAAAAKPPDSPAQKIG